MDGSGCYKSANSWDIFFWRDFPIYNCRFYIWIRYILKPDLDYEYVTKADTSNANVFQLQDPCVCTIISMWVCLTIRGSHFSCICMSTFPNQLFGERGFAERQSSLLWSFSENAHDSWTLWDIWVKFCIHLFIYLILSNHWYTKKGTRVCRASFLPVNVFLWECP